MVARCVLVAVLVLCVSASACAKASDRTEAEVNWILVSLNGDRELDLQAEFGGSSCSEFKRWDVTEDSDSVTIRATAEFFGDSCTSDLVFEPTSIVLDEPLGDRRLLGCRPDSPATAGSNRAPIDDCRQTAG